MAKFKKQEVCDGFMQGTEVGVRVQEGISVSLVVIIKLKVKTVSKVYSILSKYKNDFRGDTWQEIEKAHALSSTSFFHKLLEISAGVSCNYDNQVTLQNVSKRMESQKIAKAFQEAEETEVCNIKIYILKF